MKSKRKKLEDRKSQNADISPIISSNHLLPQFAVTQRHRPVNVFFFNYYPDLGCAQASISIRK